MNKMLMNDKTRLIKKELEKTIKQEKRYLQKDLKLIFEDQVSNITENINKKLPFDVKEKFNEAFRKGFSYVFDKGVKHIEKTYNKEKLLNGYLKDTELFNIENKKRNLLAVEKKVRKKGLLNKGISTIEGAAVGFMGIITALADVPIFISVIIKQLNETALHYGFNYNTDKERVYMLKIIAMSIAEKEAKIYLSKEIDKIGYSLDTNHSIEVYLEESIRETSSNLSEFMTTAILLQSIPVAGFIFGGLNNYQFINHITKAANLKYKKRYLYKMMEGQTK